MFIIFVNWGICGVEVHTRIYVLISFPYNFRRKQRRTITKAVRDQYLLNNKICCNEECKRLLLIQVKLDGKSNADMVIILFTYFIIFKSRRFFLNSASGWKWENEQKLDNDRTNIHDFEEVEIEIQSLDVLFELSHWVQA